VHKVRGSCDSEYRVVDSTSTVTPVQKICG
jgi:hypothetical protein